MFDKYLNLWDLVPDGEPVKPVHTHSSDLLPVRRDGEPAMLKLARSEEEQRGNRLMTWWNGDGAARVLAQRDGAVLLERAGGGSLADLSRGGRDDEATPIICAVTARLHRIPADPPELVPLTRWFSDLEQAAGRGGIFGRAAATARELLAEPLDDVVLHGDIHHSNILDFGGRGWLAIDPKGLRGERGFDYANLFCNPDDEIATDAATFSRRLSLVAAEAGLDRRRLARWVLAWVGLSILWPPFDPKRDTVVLRLSELAAAEIDQ